MINQPTSNLTKNENLFSSDVHDSSLLNAIDYNNRYKLSPSQNSNNQSLAQLLNTFNSHGLNDLDKAQLMNRVDSKFLLPISFLPDLLMQLKVHYSVLEINNDRVSNYSNQYFDTPDLTFYHNHHNGKLNRFKVRRRHYLDTDTQFLEVKLKNNQKRTIKTRIKLSGAQGEHSLCGQFINEQIEGIDNNLDVSQHSGYQRIALANELRAERLTLDFNLWYKNRRGNNTIKLPGFFIAELKQAKKSKRSPFYQLMSSNTIFPTSFSKYCIGCALLYSSSIKTNRFKATLSHVAKFNRSEPISFYKSN